jgi:hypothetical protein
MKKKEKTIFKYDIHSSLEDYEYLFLNLKYFSLFIFVKKYSFIFR